MFAVPSAITHDRQFIFFRKKAFAFEMCIFLVTSDAACWKAILISLCSNELSNIPPKLRSHDTAHTTVRRAYVRAMP